MFTGESNSPFEAFNNKKSGDLDTKSFNLFIILTFTEVKTAPLLKNKSSSDAVCAAANQSQA